MGAHLSKILSLTLLIIGPVVLLCPLIGMGVSAVVAVTDLMVVEAVGAGVAGAELGAAGAEIGFTAAEMAAWEAAEGAAALPAAAAGAEAATGAEAAAEGGAAAAVKAGAAGVEKLNPAVKQLDPARPGVYSNWHPANGRAWKEPEFLWSGNQKVPLKTHTNLAKERALRLDRGQTEMRQTSIERLRDGHCIHGYYCRWKEPVTVDREYIKGTRSVHPEDPRHPHLVIVSAPGFPKKFAGQELEVKGYDANKGTGVICWGHHSKPCTEVSELYSRCDQWGGAPYTPNGTVHFNLPGHDAGVEITWIHPIAGHCDGWDLNWHAVNVNHEGVEKADLQLLEDWITKLPRNHPPSALKEYSVPIARLLLRIHASQKLPTHELMGRVTHTFATTFDQQKGNLYKGIANSMLVDVDVAAAAVFHEFVNMLPEEDHSRMLTYMVSGSKDALVYRHLSAKARAIDGKILFGLTNRHLR